MIIYKTTNLVNGKIYIGQYCGSRLSYLGSGFILKRAIEKYDKENFKRETLEKCESKQQLNEREIYWIAYYNSMNKNVGYNRAIGGNGGFISEEAVRKMAKTKKGKKLSEEHKQKIRLGTIGKKHKPMSEEGRKNIGLAQVGKKLSEDQKRKIGNTHRGMKRPEGTGAKISRALTGRKLSLEHREKLSIAHKGKPSFWIGKKRAPTSEKTKEKLREAARKYKENKNVSKGI